MTEQILIITENPYYKRKKELNKNEKILKGLGLKKVDIVNYTGRSRQAVEQDFKHIGNMSKKMADKKTKRGIFYAEKIAEMTGRNIDKEIFLCKKNLGLKK